MKPYYLDKLGWPVECIKGRRFLNFIRRLIHTRRVTMKRPCCLGREEVREMAAKQGQMECKLYPSAFSGEVVVQVDTVNQNYEGIAPKHYVESSTPLSKDGVDGRVKVRVLNNDRKEARVRVPDSQVLTVLADKVHEI